LLGIEPGRVGVEDAWHELRSAVTVVEYNAGHEGISGEQRFAVRQAGTCVADCVAGGAPDLWATRHVNDVVCARDDRLVVWCMCRADFEESGEEAPCAEFPEGPL
jgi:hypothetical protein